MLKTFQASRRLSSQALDAISPGFGAGDWFSLSVYTLKVYDWIMHTVSGRRRPKSAALRNIARTNIVINPALVAKVKRLAGVKTTREAVNISLDHFTRSRDYSDIVNLYGTGGVAKNYDPKVVKPASKR